MGQERRRHPRVVVDVPARLSAGGETLPGRVQDICVDAALVEADREFPLGTTLSLEVELPRVAGTVRASGRVIRIAPYADGKHSMAVLFDELTPDSRMRVDLFISEQEG